MAQLSREFTAKNGNVALWIESERLNSDTFETHTIKLSVYGKEIFSRQTMYNREAINIYEFVKSRIELCKDIAIINSDFDDLHIIFDVNAETKQLNMHKSARNCIIKMFKITSGKLDPHFKTTIIANNDELFPVYTFYTPDEKEAKDAYDYFVECVASGKHYTVEDMSAVYPNHAKILKKLESKEIVEDIDIDADDEKDDDEKVLTHHILHEHDNKSEGGLLMLILRENIENETASYTVRFIIRQSRKPNRISDRHFVNYTEAATLYKKLVKLLDISDATMLHMINQAV